MRLLRMGWRIFLHGARAGSSRLSTGMIFLIGTAPAYVNMDIGVCTEERRLTPTHLQRARVDT
jgi:hypothetical protein